MRIDILTLFPKMFKNIFDESIIKRAQNKGLLEIEIHNLRDWAEDKRGTVDDKPYGGGTGMILKVDVIDRALKEIKKKTSKKNKTILLTPQGRVFNQAIAQDLAKEENLILICGHYEGVDERVRENLIDQEISIGDYVLTGGEIPAMVLVDTITRLIPKVLEKEEATKDESFQKNRLEHPQYTRPEEYQGWQVPEVLVSGNHQEIKEWREKKSLEKTKKKRPELLNSDEAT